MNEISLRPYQELDNNNINEAFKTYRSVLYQLPTGGGKSVIIAKQIIDRPNKNILVLAHKRRLLTQIKERLEGLNIDVGYIQGSNEDNTNAHVVIASIRTVMRDNRIQVLLDRDWDMVVIDEARHTRQSSYEKVLDKLIEHNPLHLCLGVDATPYRKDKKRLDKYFQHLLCSSETIESLIEKNYLAKYRIYATPIDNILEEVKEVANDFQLSQLSEYMRKPKYLQYVVDSYQKWGENRPTIVFAVDKAHAGILEQTFISNGILSIETIHSDLSSEEIDAYLQLYEAGDIQILINVEMLTEGVDLPDTSCIIGVRPTKSLPLYLQMMGRGTRLKSNNDDLIIIDCAGNTAAFGTISSPRNWSLDPEVDPNNLVKSRVIVGRDKKGKLTNKVEDFDEFTEILEMSPEEYYSSIANSLEAATQHNKSIDERIIDKLNELLTGFVNAINDDKNAPYCVGGVLSEDNYSESKKQFIICRQTDKEIVLANKRRPEVIYFSLQIDLNGEELPTLDLLNVKSYYEGTYIKSTALTSYMMLGVIAKVLQARLDAFLHKVNEAKQLYISKLNLQTFQDAKKKHEEEQWHRSVEEYVAAGKVFVLNSRVWCDSHFKALGGVIVKFKVEGSLKGHHNNLSLFLGSSENPISKGYISKEKVLAILKDGGWKDDSQ